MNGHKKTQNTNNVFCNCIREMGRKFGLVFVFAIPLNVIFNCLQNSHLTWTAFSFFPVSISLCALYEYIYNSQRQEPCAARKLNGVEWCQGLLLLFVMFSFCFLTGGQCSCSSYSSLLYALSSAVAILLLFLLLAFVVIYKVSGLEVPHLHHTRNTE